MSSRHFNISIRVDADVNRRGEICAQWVQIEVSSDHYSCGVIALDSAQDLYALRDACDAYIIQNHIKPPLTTDNED